MRLKTHRYRHENNIFNPKIREKLENPLLNA